MKSVTNNAVAPTPTLGQKQSTAYLRLISVLSTFGIGRYDVSCHNSKGSCTHNELEPPVCTINRQQPMADLGTVAVS